MRSKKTTTDRAKLKKFDSPFMGKATKMEVIDIGNEVLCDSCNKDYTDSDEQGGFLFGTNNTYCPDCAPSALERIKGYGEDKYITAYCPAGMSFKDFVLGLRGGDNTIKFVEYDK